MSSLTIRSIGAFLGATLILIQVPWVVPPAEAAPKIVILRGVSLDGEGTPFEEPEGDEIPKQPYLGDESDDLPDRPGVEEPNHYLGHELLSKWFPILSWYARLRS